LLRLVMQWRVFYGSMTKLQIRAALPVNENL
jgi:hypothetical protein